MTRKKIQNLVHNLLLIFLYTNERVFVHDERVFVHDERVFVHDERVFVCSERNLF